MSEDHAGHLDEWLMQEYLDEWLAHEDGEKLEAHLGVCEDCSAEFERLKILFSEMKRLPDEPLPRDLTERVIRSLARKEKRIPYLQQVLAAQLVTAVIVLIATWPRISVALASKISLARLSVPLRRFMELSTQGMHSVGEVLNWISDQWIEPLSMPAVDWPITGIPLALVVGGVILLWLLGNGLLLREPVNASQP